MSNIVKISFYEKLHAIFEKVSPEEISIKLDQVAGYFRKGTGHYYLETGKAFPMDEYLERLEAIKHSLTLSILHTRQSLALACDGDRWEEADGSPDGLATAITEEDLDIIKKAMVQLANETNQASFQKNYQVLENLSIILEVYYHSYVDHE